ncbi:MAG TPA: XRE family transcriptional regulator, partial [Novosphingobium sp.]|nr:XRE family transcriptional regulator [Novosphingobium sp.]
WMNRIAAALEVDPELLVRAETAAPARFIARLAEGGAEPLAAPRDAILPVDLARDGALVALDVEQGAGEYRTGDQVWLRQCGPEHFARMLNRDVLAPRPGGRFAFGRMIDRDEQRVALLPPGPGTRQVVIDNPAWLAVAEMLVRRL